MTRLLQDLVIRQAAARPDAPAVVGDDGTVTYGELDARSGRLASAIRDAGCERGDRVCLLVPKTPAALVGILGTLKADCTYVPLDPESPPSRLAKMVSSCEPGLLLAAPETADEVEELLARVGDGLRVGWLDDPPGKSFAATAFCAADLEGAPKAAPPAQNDPDDPAYILFTSGTTGEPKGVVITHRNVIAFVEWAVRHFGMDETDRVSGHPPLHFDLSAFDIFGAFAAGASLHLVPAELSLLPHKVAEFIRGRRLTQWFSVPSLLAYMARFDVVREGDFPSLRRLLWCGEVFPTPPLIYWMERLPHVRFTNLYGPTEATIASSFFDLSAPPESESAEIPIGTPCAGEELLVLDEGLRPASAGEVGELYIRGVGLSPGYWRDAERTREAFLPDPSSPDGSGRIYRTGDLARIGEDGLVYFEGRCDHQIKSRGHRIELGEVENALHTVPALAECAAFPATTNGFEGTAVGCAYVPLPGAEMDPTTIRAELEEHLPSYMVPTRWIELDALPRNKSGKIDRRRLADLLEERCA